MYKVRRFCFYTIRQPLRVTGFFPFTGIVPIHSVNAVFFRLFGPIHHGYNIAHPFLRGMRFPSVLVRCALRRICAGTAGRLVRDTAGCAGIWCLQASAQPGRYYLHRCYPMWLGSPRVLRYWFLPMVRIIGLRHGQQVGGIFTGTRPYTEAKLPRQSRAPARPLSESQLFCFSKEILCLVHSKAFFYNY